MVFIIFFWTVFALSPAYFHACFYHGSECLAIIDYEPNVFGISTKTTQQPNSHLGLIHLEVGTMKTTLIRVEASKIDATHREME